MAFGNGLMSLSPIPTPTPKLNESLAVNLEGPLRWLPLRPTPGPCKQRQWIPALMEPSCVSVSCSVVSDSATPWTVAHQVLPSIEFSRQEYRRGLHSLLQGIFLTRHCRRWSQWIPAPLSESSSTQLQPHLSVTGRGTGCCPSSPWSWGNFQR